MTDEHFYGPRQIRPILAQANRDCTDIAAARKFLTEKLGKSYSISITRKGQWGKFTITLTSESRTIESSGDELVGAVRRILWAA